MFKEFASTQVDEKKAVELEMKIQDEVKSE